MSHQTYGSLLATHQTLILSIITCGAGRDGAEAVKNEDNRHPHNTKSSSLMEAIAHAIENMNKDYLIKASFLTIAISDLSPEYETQQWHTMTPASVLPSSENLQSNAISPRSSIRQSVGSFNSSDAIQTNPEVFTAATSAKRSISLVGPPPTNLLAGRIRKLSKHTMSGSELRMNVGVGNGGSNSSSGSSNAVLPQIRLAVKYQSIDVLPLHYYDDLRRFNKENLVSLIVEKSKDFVQYLEPILSTKKKEEIAHCLVNIHEKAPESNIAAFLAPLVDQELDTYENLSLLFRSNSICSKAVECYIKLVGAEYLQQLLRGFIENLLTSTEDLEVDPSRLNGMSLSPGSDSGNSSGSTEADSSLLHGNQTALMNAVKIVWQRLQASLSYFPSDLRESLSSIRRTVRQRHGQEVADQLISGCLFLRYICPAIHGPTLFGLTNAVPDDPRVSRNLTLLAKVLQTIANFSHFEAKENYMRFLNDFVQSMQEEMHQFLRAVSTIEEENNSGIWKRQMKNVSNCHNSIDLGYELTMLYRQLRSILEEHPKVPVNLAELPGILASITQMLSTPSLRRSFSNIGNGTRAATSTALEDTMNVRAGTLRFLSTVNSRTLNGLQITPAEQPATPASIYSSGSEFTPRRISSAGLQRCSFEISSPGSESISQQQAFFGESFEPGFDDSRGTDLASISETEGDPACALPELLFTRILYDNTSVFVHEAALTHTLVKHPLYAALSSPLSLNSLSYPLESSLRLDQYILAQAALGVLATALPPEAKNSTSPTSNLSYHTSENTSISCPNHFRSTSAQRLRIPLNSSSLQRCKEVESNSLTSGSPTTNTLPTPSPQKWSSGPELRTDSPVVLNFPPPPPSLPQQQREGGGLGGSSTNIRMGTRAIRMSRERDLSGHHETGSSICNGDEIQESIQLSTVPVILQCETPGNLDFRKGGDGSILSVDSAASYESSSSSCLSMMPQANNSTTPGISGGGQSVFVAENTHYFELPADRVSPAIAQRGCRIPNTSANAANTVSNSDQALLNRVHNLLFGGNGSRNEYQNVRGIVRPVTSTTTTNSAKISEKHELQISETSQLEVLQQKLKAMEEHLNRERQDMQKAVASNMRMMESQERCISELIEEINRLQSLRSSKSGNSSANTNSGRSNDSTSLSPAVSQSQ
ncbi:hypothetical protein ACTXT7_006460 [Hymenolepis weldensis]